MCLAAIATGLALSITVFVPVSVATDAQSRYSSCLVPDVLATYVSICRLVSCVRVYCGLELALFTKFAESFHAASNQ